MISKNLECNYCKEKFDSKSRNSKQKYCSRSCARKGSPNKNQFKKGVPSWNTGLSVSGMSGKAMTQQHKDKISKANSGKNAPNWKGGISEENYRLRRTGRYKAWRKMVFERDGYICQHCGDKSTKGKRVRLNADHIKPFALYPHLRFELSNGRTLCEPCHRKTPTWGYTGKKATLESTGQTYEDLKNERA